MDRGVVARGGGRGGPGAGALMRGETRRRHVVGNTTRRGRRRRLRTSTCVRQRTDACANVPSPRNSSATVVQLLPSQSTHAGTEHCALLQSTAEQSAGGASNAERPEQQQSSLPVASAGWLTGRPGGMTTSPYDASRASFTQSAQLPGGGRAPSTPITNNSSSSSSNAKARTHVRKYKCT